LPRPTVRANFRQSLGVQESPAPAGRAPGHMMSRVLGSLPGPWLAGPKDSSGSEGCAYPAVLLEIAAGTQAMKRAFADTLHLRVRAFKAHMPRDAGRRMMPFLAGHTIGRTAPVCRLVLIASLIAGSGSAAAGSA